MGDLVWLSNATIQSFQIPIKPKPLLFSSLSSSLRCYACPSFKVNHSVPPPKIIKGSIKRLECSSSAATTSGKPRDAVLPVTEEPSRSELKRKKMAVFVSGGGSNFKSIHEACVQGSVHGDIVVLVTNKHGCGGAEYARNKGIPVILFPQTKNEPDGLSATDLVSILRLGLVA
uniref:phosphoribosylglycinamide formyltransferase 1 n=1 Tax=Rhizophora mucronata TaxID=61149 RepID=A0A2P2JFS6_RHIMU